jgi:glycosyltransferase involved in cell wall biosynthesis
MNPSSITPVILTYNEEPNLRRCLESVKWAERVIIIDSGSTDGTAEIAAKYGNVQLMTRAFDNHTAQWNFGLAAATTDYCLSLDADYILPEGFAQEVNQLSDGPVAWYARFRYCIQGRPLRASLYPPRAILFRRDACQYVQDGHTQLLSIKGEHGMLQSVLDHDDRKPLSRWLASQDKYAQLEAEKLAAAPTSELRLQDRIRRAMFLAPPVTLIYTLLIRRTLLDGLPGIYYAFQRTLAELVLSLRLTEYHWRKRNSQND